jgi:hypothetical protein
MSNNAHQANNAQDAAEAREQAIRYAPFPKSPINGQFLSFSSAIQIQNGNNIKYLESDMVLASTLQRSPVC